MKKLFSLFLALVASTGTIFATYWSPVLIGKFYYFLDDENYSAYVTYSSYDGLATYNEDWGITTATIPPSVSYDNISFTVTAIGSHAFSNCQKLTSISIPSTVTGIGEAAFAGCINLETINIPRGIKSIEPYTFLNCSSLTTIDIPNTVIGIGKAAFEGCTGFSYINLPNNVNSIGFMAFHDCANLSINIPSSVTNLEERAFDGCLSVTVYSSSIISTDYEYSTGMTGLLGAKKITIGDGIFRIGNYVFTDNSDVLIIEIPNSVTSIGEGAFEKCTGLTSIEIPSSIIDIGVYAFSSCTNLATVKLAKGLANVGEGAFWGCSNLNSIEIPNSVTNIGTRAFEKCSSLTSVTIPNNVTSIEQFTFSNCSNLKAITIPYNVIEIGWMAFSSCSALTSVTIPNSVTSIRNNAFSGCSALTSITIPNSVTSIENNAFSGCSTLTSVMIDSESILNKDMNNNSGTIVIGDNSMKYIFGDQVQEYIIGNSIKSVGDGAFYRCTSLSVITIPNSVINIGAYAFYKCTGLTSITCEAVTPPTCGYSVFDGVNKSIPLYVPAGSVDAYKAADQWKDFGDNIRPIQAKQVDVIEPTANPTSNTVVVEWPAMQDAEEYTITLKKEQDTVCSLNFNGQGELMSISYKAPAKHGIANKNRQAVQTTIGWQYSISGLDANTEYTYIIVAKKSDDTIIYDKSVQFKTKDSDTATGIDQITNDKSPITNKIIKDNQLLILHGDHTYTITGQEVK